MMTLDEAIAHAREVAEKLKEKAKLMREGSKNGLFYPKDFEDCETCAAEHKQLASWLEELKARREADRWIPVSERLPEESDDYLIQLDNNWNEQLTAFFSKGVGFCFLGSVLTDVIYWRPLPEPYKESEDK